MEQEYNQLNHATWDCKYHAVFAPKYRKTVLFGKIKRAWSGFSRSGAP
jgi:putative transposase